MNSLEFNYHSPKTLDEAINILNKCDNPALLAGGTDVLVEIKKGLRQADDIVSIKNLNELKIIKQKQNEIIIGSSVTHNEVKNSPLIKKKLFALSEAASNIGADQVRNTATIGGNICTGASCCDMAPVLLAYNSELEILSSTEKRMIHIKDFFLAHKKTSINKGEILTKIIIHISDDQTGVSFLKFGLRDAASISVASVSVMIKFSDKQCIDSRIVIGAVAPTPILCSKASKLLCDFKLTDFSNENILSKVGESAAEDSLPIDDIRGSADYRRKLVKVLTQRAIKIAFERAKYI